MKLILRGDDLGFSEGVNHGINKAIRDGLITSVGLMSNMDSARHGYELIKDTNICLGLHTNICVGYPCSDPKDIPSLVQDNGMFCTSSEIRQRNKDTVVLEEVILEIEAQIQRFKEITGRFPDYLECHAVSSKNLFRGLKIVAKKYDLFYENVIFDPEWEEETGIKGFPFPELDNNNHYNILQHMKDHISLLNQYIGVMVFHPGYLDQYLLDHSSFTLIRPWETQFLCSQELKDYINNHNIELISFNEVKE